MRTASQRGFVSAEFALGVGVLLLPLLLLVTVLPTWAERVTLARSAAQEAARAAVVAAGCAQGQAAAAAVVDRVAASYELASRPRLRLQGDWCAAGVISRGGSATARVTVEVPAMTLPLGGSVGGFGWTAVHTEHVDDYRSVG